MLSLANMHERYLFGIKLEDPAINKAKFTYFLAGAAIARILKRIRIENGLVVPRVGSALIVMAPHTSFWDPPMTYYAIATQAKRSMRMIAADYVVDPNLPQDPKELEKTGKKPHPKWKRHFISWHAGIGHPISYNRSDEGREALAEIDQTESLGRIIAVSLQETRRKPWEPNPARIGAAKIALRQPNLPIIPMAIIGMERLFGPVTVRFGNPFTVEQLGLDVNNRRSLIIVHDKITSETANLLPEETAKNLQVRDKDLR